MVRDILMKMKTPEIRKYITAHNKTIRQYIGLEIKEARVAYSKNLKIKRREMKQAQEINAKGKKKEELIDLIMKEPAIVKKIKYDNDNKTFDPLPTGGGAAEKKDIRKSKPTQKVLDIKEQIKKKADKIKEDRKGIAEKSKKPKPPADEIKRIPDMKKLIKDGRKKGKPLKGLEFQLKELEEKYDLSGIDAAPKQKKPLTVTRADGSVSILKKKVRDKRSILDRKKPVKIPKITITEAKEDIAKQQKKEIKSSLGSIPKSKIKIRVKPKQQDIEEQEDDEVPYNRKKVIVINEISKDNKAGWLDLLESFFDEEEDPTMESVTQKAQERIYKNLITREKGFINRIKKNEKGKGTAKEQKERRIKNSRILVGVREDIRNKPNIRKLFNTLNPEIMKGLIKKNKDDEEKEKKEKVNKDKENDKFINENIKFLEEDIKDVKKRNQNPATIRRIEELEEQIEDEKEKLSKNK